MPHYWIDTDPGLDDALAILLAIREAGRDLVGLSTVQGNVDEPVAANNLARLLATFTARGLTPPGWQPVLARGSQRALAGRPPVRAIAVHGDDGLGGLPWSPGDLAGRFGPTFAPQALLDALHTFPDLHLVCLGPLTNLALTLCLDPELPIRLPKLTIMGGSLRAGGNASAAAEFNFLADPDAARIVLEAGFPELTLVPLDGCYQARMTIVELEQLRSLGSAAARTTAELLAPWQEPIARKGQAVYDLLAWQAATHPELFEWRELAVEVDVGSDVGRGASVADWRSKPDRGPNLRAALGLDRAGVFELLWRGLA